MKRLLVLVAVVLAICFIGAPARAQETVSVEPGIDLWGMVKVAAKWIVENGDIAYLYDFVGEDTGSLTTFRLTLFEIYEVLDIDLGVGLNLKLAVDNFDRPEEVIKKPVLFAGLSMTMGNVLGKFDRDWPDNFPDVRLGLTAGYDLEVHDVLVGPLIAISF